MGSTRKINIENLLTEEVRTPMFCNLCVKNFASKSNLRRHWNTIHLGEKKCICDIC